MDKVVQETCDTCRLGQPSPLWVTYPDGQLRRLVAVVCMKGIIGVIAPVGKPWVDYPKPNGVKNAKDSCPAWKGRGK